VLSNRDGLFENLTVFKTVPPSFDSINILLSVGMMSL